MATNKALDIFLIYHFLKRLVKPFEKTDAYKLGIIDKDGKKIKSPETDEEKDAYRMYDRLVFNMKRLLSKIPGGRSRLGSFAAALLLVKEGNEDLASRDISYLQERLEHEIKFFDPNLLKKLEEAAPANAAGPAVGGNVAGLGSSPPVKKKKKPHKRWETFYNSKKTGPRLYEHLTLTELKSLDDPYVEDEIAYRKMSKILDESVIDDLFEEISLLYEEVSVAQLKKIKEFFDQKFGSKFSLDFSKHFLNQVNSKRNDPPITVQDIVSVYRKLWLKHLKGVTKMRWEDEGLVKDSETNINLPFVIKKGPNNTSLIRAKTIIRKKNFGNDDFNNEVFKV